MARLKNITPASIALQMFHTDAPQVNYAIQSVVLSLKPGEDVDEAIWIVRDIHDVSYNSDLIDKYIANGILTRIP